MLDALSLTRPRLREVSDLSWATGSQGGFKSQCPAPEQCFFPGPFVFGSGMIDEF